VSYESSCRRLSDSSLSCILDGKSSRFPGHGVGSHPSEIYNRLEEYYGRGLSFDTDNINALLGIFQALDHVTHFYGIPIVSKQESNNADMSVSMAQSLAWQVDGCHYTNPGIHAPQLSRNPYPSWTWAAFKASQPKSDPGLLELRFRRSWASFELDGAIQLRICYSSGSWMSLSNYVDHPDSYIAFLPYIEITSTTMESSLLRGPSGFIRFSACPNMDLRLHLPPESVPEKATAIYVGCIPKSEGMATELGFILVEVLSDNRYRRIGVSSFKTMVHPYQAMCSDSSKCESSSEMTKYDSALQKLCQSAPWCTQTLVLV
jgi:hypothetical protein